MQRAINPMGWAGHGSERIFSTIEFVDFLKRENEIKIKIIM
jgi:hypothetical protein